MPPKWQNPPTVEPTWLPVADMPDAIKTDGTVIDAGMWVDGGSASAWLDGIARWYDLGGDGSLTGWAAHTFFGQPLDRVLKDGFTHWKRRSPPPEGG